MKNFLREYWLYILAPIALVILGIIILAMTSDDPSSPFQY